MRLDQGTAAKPGLVEPSRLTLELAFCLGLFIISLFIIDYFLCKKTRKYFAEEDSSLTFWAFVVP